MGCLWNTLRCLPFPTCILDLITCYKVVHGLVSVSRSGKTKARNVSVTRQKAENCDAPEFSVRLNGETEGHPACKKLSGGVLACYLSGARCRLAYGPADATATHCLLLQ